MRLRQGVICNPCPLYSLLSLLARDQFIFTTLITWQKFTILTRNFQNMIKGALRFLGAFLNLVQLTHLVRTYMIMVNYKIPL